MITMTAYEFTERARELFAVLDVRREWVSRAQLARGSGKNRLSPHDVDLLDEMEAAGLIEKRQRASNTPVGIAYDYRVK